MTLRTNECRDAAVRRRGCFSQAERISYGIERSLFNSEDLYACKAIRIWIQCLKLLKASSRDIGLE